MRCILHGIYEDQRAGLTTQIDDLGNRVDRAQRVGRQTHCHQFWPVFKGPFQIFQDKGAVLNIEIHPVDGASTRLGDL